MVRPGRLDRVSIPLMVSFRPQCRPASPGGSASVALAMSDGREIDKQRIMAVANFVAGAVSGLELKNVKITDAALGNLSGLTTAAGLWCVAAVGLACGFGLYVLATDERLAEASTAALAIASIAPMAPAGISSAPPVRRAVFHRCSR